MAPVPLSLENHDLYFGTESAMTSGLQSDLAQAESQTEERHGSSGPRIVSQRTVAAYILGLNAGREHPSASHPHPLEGTQENKLLGECRKAVG